MAVNTLNGLDGFDPLYLGEMEKPDVSKLISDAQRRDVLNILRSYTGTLDVFSEAIQNCIDAVDIKARNDDSYTPRIWIKIDLKNNIVRFVDNGTGMLEDELRYFLRPNVSFKADAQVRGHKGVGATFLAYGYTSFSVHTMHQKHQMALSLTGGRQWAESPTDNVPRPRFAAIPFDVPELAGEQSGTCVEIVIGNHRDERPNLSWLGISKPEVWFKVLRLKSPLGGVYLKAGGIKPKYRISVTDVAGDTFIYEAEADDAEFYWPHTFSVCTRTKDVVEVQRELDKRQINRRDMASKLPSSFRNLDCIYNIWDWAQLTDDDGPFSDDFSGEEKKNLIAQHEVLVYGCFVRSRTIWDSFQQNELGVRPQYKVIQGGLQLASDYMVQGDLTTIPLRTAAGYQANAFIIVHFTHGNPDLGRKAFQPELREVAEDISRRVVAELRKYHALLKPDTGAYYTSPSKDLDDWKDSQKDWMKRYPLRLAVDGKDVPLVSLPREEQDVIALYHQLIGMGAVRGLQFYSTGYNTKYDGLFQYKYDVSHKFSADTPWGVDPRYTPGESGLLVLEYKYSLDGLIRDLEKEEKNSREISLVICYEMGSEFRKRFHVVSYMVGQEGGAREIFGSTHVAYAGVGPGMKEFEIVSLADVIHFYEDPSSLSARHQSLYP